MFVCLPIFTVTHVNSLALLASLVELINRDYVIAPIRDNVSADKMGDLALAFLSTLPSVLSFYQFSDAFS